jgi:choline kinase
LLWHTLEQLVDAGATDAVVVCGHRGDQLRSTLIACPKRPHLSFVTNSAYRTTNSMYSLWLTRSWWDRPFCVVDGDLLVGRELLDRVFRANGDHLVVDTTRRYVDIEMHAKVVGGLVTRLDNALAAEDSSGEFFGVSCWTPEGAADIATAISRRLSNGGWDRRYAEAIGDVARRRSIGAIRATQSEWAEVDRPGDIPNAERLLHQWRSRSFR